MGYTDIEDPNAGPETTMRQTYETLEGKTVQLAGLQPEERVYLADIFKRYEQGINYLSFKHLYADPDSPAFKNAKRLGRAAEEAPVYQVCEDLATRLGVRQRYLVKEEVVPYAAPKGEARKELTTGEVAKLAGCTRQAVRKAIVTWRLRARKVGRLALVWDKDAEAFANALKGRRGAKKRRTKELTHA